MAVEDGPRLVDSCSSLDSILCHIGTGARASSMRPDRHLGGMPHLNMATSKWGNRTFCGALRATSVSRERPKNQSLSPKNGEQDTGSPTHEGH
jgi:hypothetical protein